MSDPITIAQEENETPLKRSFRKPALIVGAAVAAVAGVYLLARKTAPEATVLPSVAE